MPIEKLIFITSHKAKAEQLSWHLKFPIEYLNLDELFEIQSLDHDLVAWHKVSQAYERVGKPVLVEDISIGFNALGKLPGTYIKDFLDQLKPTGLCKLLDGYDDRSAVIRPTFALHTGKDIHLFSAEMEGTIAQKPRGDEKFGTDTIFIPKGWDKTWGEMSEEEGKKSSVRRLALLKLQDFLENQK